jgi:hypothetical protein
MSTSLGVGALRRSFEPFRALTRPMGNAHGGAMSENSYPAIDLAKALQAQLELAFGAPEVRRFAHLPVIGCCEEHERDFAWYRTHHWGEMPEAIAAGRLDAFEVSSLHQAVYYAFVPGLCLHALKTVAAAYQGQDFSRIGLDDWLLAGLLPIRKVAGAERQLSLLQNRCVAAILYFFDECLTEIKGHPLTVEAPGGHLPLRELIEQHWGDESLFRAAAR